MGCHFLLQGSSPPGDRTQVSCIVSRCFYHLSHEGSSWLSRRTQSKVPSAQQPTHFYESRLSLLSCVGLLTFCNSLKTQIHFTLQPLSCYSLFLAAVPDFADASTFTHALSTPKLVRWPETVLNIIWLPAWELNLSSAHPVVSTRPPSSNPWYLAQRQPEGTNCQEPAVREEGLEGWCHSHQLCKMILRRVRDCPETKGSIQ